MWNWLSTWPLHSFRNVQVWRGYIATPHLLTLLENYSWHSHFTRRTKVFGLCRGKYVLTLAACSSSVTEQVSECKESPDTPVSLHFLCQNKGWPRKAANSAHGSNSWVSRYWATSLNPCRFIMLWLCSGEIKKGISSISALQSHGDISWRSTFRTCLQSPILQGMEHTILESNFYEAPILCRHHNFCSDICAHPGFCCVILKCKADLSGLCFCILIYQWVTGEQRPWELGWVVCLQLNDQITEMLIPHLLRKRNSTLKERHITDVSMLCFGPKNSLLYRFHEGNQ